MPNGIPPPDIVRAGVVMWEHISPVVAIAVFALQFLGTIIAGVWKLSQVDVGLRKAIYSSGKEIDERIDAQARQVGETVSALRQKIHEVELHIRDTYVRRESFNSGIQELAKRIENRIDRLENKMNGGD